MSILFLFSFGLEKLYKMSTQEFTQAILANQDFLRGSAMQITRDQEQAADLVQETNLKALRSMGRFKPGTNLKAWLYTILRNTFINQYRKEKNRKTTRDESENGYILGSYEAAPEQEADASIHMKEIQSVMRSVEQQLLKPFMMYIEGYKYMEIAEKLHIPEGTVKSRIFKARKKMQSQLTQYGYF